MALTLVAGVTALIAQALPGAAAGALGGWIKTRREPETAATTTTRWPGTVVTQFRPGTVLLAMR